MHSLHNSKDHGHQVLVPSPQCTLNCQALSIHLPPLGQGRDSIPNNNYISPPMSASWDRSKFDESYLHRSNGHRQYSLTPPSTSSRLSTSTTSRPPTSSGKLSPTNARTVHANNQLGKDVRGDLSTPSSTDRETPGISSRLGSDNHTTLGESNEDFSSNAQDSPEGQLVAGPPGIARRAKAHVPSACVNCKKKHLACETKRPCSRCVQTGKEVRYCNGTSQSFWKVLISFRLAALTFSTKNEVGLASVKKTAFERLLSEVNILMLSYTRALTVLPILNLIVAARRRTESCALSRRSHTRISDQGRPILRTRNRPTCMEPPHTRFQPPLIPFLMSLFQRYSLHLISWSLNTTAHSAMLCPSRSQPEHKPSST